MAIRTQRGFATPNPEQRRKISGDGRGEYGSQNTWYEDEKYDDHPGGRYEEDDYDDYHDDDRRNFSARVDEYNEG